MCLSGLTGTKIKTKLVESYYSFWLSVTTRGRGYFATKPVYIVDMNAGTGLVKFEETGNIAYGSAGHALDRKYGSKKSLNEKLRIILIESMPECRDALFDNINKNWSEAELSEYKPNWYRSNDECVDFFKSVDDFLKYTKPTALGNSLFYFDPLLAPDLELIEQIASARIDKPYKINTEFLIFFFTSDWISGRKNFSALPRTDDESSWTSDEKISAHAADKAFGDRAWLKVMTSEIDNESLGLKLIELYKKSLRKWFRFVQPLPFVPKIDQRYDLFCCSNFDTGMNAINRIYDKITGKKHFDPDNRTAYSKFLQKYPHLRMSGKTRHTYWKCLWHIIRYHIDGICDERCEGGIRESIRSIDGLRKVLQWLHDEDFIVLQERDSWMWPNHRQFPEFVIDWKFIKQILGVEPPKTLTPLTPEDLTKPRPMPDDEQEPKDDLQTTLDEF